jgi:hypothetical protein
MQTRFGFLILVAALGTLSACSNLNLGNAPPGRDEYRPRYGFVRVEQSEPGAAENAHPFSISVEALRQRLVQPKVSGSVSMSAVPLFTEEELTEFAAPLAAALAKAGPHEDVVFVVAGNRGLFGAYSPKFYTTGRLFVRNERINLILGQVHERYEGEEWSARGSRKFLPGSRAQRVDAGWTVDPAGAQQPAGRPDWLLFDTRTIPVAAPTVPSTSTPPAAESRSSEIENRLRTLQQLKDKGLITDEEYRERRRAILQSL